MINTDFYIILLENYSTLDKHLNVGGPRPGPTGPRPKNGSGSDRVMDTQDPSKEILATQTLGHIETWTHRTLKKL